jgi:hypothetical protein
MVNRINWMIVVEYTIYNRLVTGNISVTGAAVHTLVLPSACLGACSSFSFPIVSSPCFLLPLLLHLLDILSFPPCILFSLLGPQPSNGLLYNCRQSLVVHILSFSS